MRRRVYQACDSGSETIRTRGGRLLVPVQVCPVGPDGRYLNPGGGYSYHFSHHFAWEVAQFLTSTGESESLCMEPICLR